MADSRGGARGGARGGQEGQKKNAGWYTHSKACINSGGRGLNSGSLPWVLDNTVLAVR